MRPSKLAAVIEAMSKPHNEVKRMAVDSKRGGNGSRRPEKYVPKLGDWRIAGDLAEYTDGLVGKGLLIKFYKWVNALLVALAVAVAGCGIEHGWMWLALLAVLLLPIAVILNHLVYVLVIVFFARYNEELKTRRLLERLVCFPERIRMHSARIDENFCKCRHCGRLMEVPEGVVLGQNLRCPWCDGKFEYNG